ncbi:MAG: UdgX family uracil-DNA binding protein, partial [Burkholderiales bacterium]
MKVARLAAATDFDGWRTAARALMLNGVAAEDVEWVVGNAASLLEDPALLAAPSPGSSRFTVPKQFIALAQDAILHRDSQRFGLLYRLLWRLRGEPRLLSVATDEDVTRARNMQKAVARDIHKMHAYVRFRESREPEGAVYVAWFEPSHHIVAAAAPFFVRRFASMRWSILTPDASAYWDGAALHMGPGASRANAPDGDALETLWRSYYKSIFNPARLKVATMQSQMPRKYWGNLPEAALIPELIAKSSARTLGMIAADATVQRRRVTKYEPKPVAAPVDTIDALRRHAAECRACPLYEHATQTVFGEGPTPGAVMFVGEQPGDQEDLAGRPFVGPAGKIFERALSAAGIARDAVYVTNAVKHFKYEARGKRRLHKTPAQREIEACRPWLEQEIMLVEPKLIVAMGATAAHAVLGKVTPIEANRGRFLRVSETTQVLVTVHPSYLLRVPVEQHENEYARFVDDLRMVESWIARQ